MSMTDQAVELASSGFRVFPLHGLTSDGICSCRQGAQCPRPAKHPRAAGWQSIASSTPLIVRSLFEQWHSANIGIATGDGLVVIDCDSSAAEYAFRAQFASDGMEVKTRQGSHFYFTHPTSERIRTLTAWREGIDVRAEGGLVVAPGSQHVSGHVYAFAGGPLGPIPEALLATLPRVHERETHFTFVSCTDEMPYADQIVRELYVDAMLTSDGGGRNALLFRLACQLYETIAEGLLHSNRMNELMMAAESAGLSAYEVRRTIESAITNAQKGR